MQPRWKLFVSALGVAVLMLSAGIEAASPALASASARPASSAPASKAQASKQSVAARQAKEFLSHIKVGGPLNHVGAYRGSATAGITPLSSTNWSGYADSGAAHAFTTVSGSWVEPTADCTGGTTIAAFWVGIDGISNADPTVQQDGTIIECSGTSAFYYDWWETYPGNAVQIKNSVSPGDHISARVNYNGSYAMSVTDSTHSADSFSVSEPCGASTCENESAEWIAEAPCCKSGSQVYNLADFGTWKLKQAATTYNGTLGSITVAPTTDEITMIDSSNKVKAQPKALNAADDAFKVVWERAS